MRQPERRDETADATPVVSTGTMIGPDKLIERIGEVSSMSPEQAQVSAVDVNTRSDVYSLGVLSDDGEPTTLAKQRMVAVPQSPSSMRGVDWIVMKAVEKDRSLRCEFCRALAADVERYLKRNPSLRAHRVPSARGM